MPARRHAIDDVDLPAPPVADEQHAAVRVVDQPRVNELHAAVFEPRGEHLVERPRAFIEIQLRRALREADDAVRTSIEPSHTVMAFFADQVAVFGGPHQNWGRRRRWGAPVRPRPSRRRPTSRSSVRVWRDRFV